MIPYGKQCIDEEDIQAVVDVLRSDWLTTGPTIEQFEKAFTDFVGAKYAVAVNSGTAALHAATFALGIGPGDEVIVPGYTFFASCAAVVAAKAIPVIARVAGKGTLHWRTAARKISRLTKQVRGLQGA
jgi:dTDP-4-amino-4,6-dideoxygalactose transaminase